MIVRKMVRALDERLGFAPLLRKGLGKVFPDHWSFMLGEIALYSFIILVLTGVFLTLFFEPSSADTVYTGGYAPMRGQHTSAAYASALELSWDVRLGLVMRQTHHWSALVFIAAIIVHQLRIFFTGAFRKPREINWVVGVTMLALALFNGFTGYSMPDDLLSGTGLRIAYAVAESIPIIGQWLAFIAFGGVYPARETEPRLYISHVLLVPALLAVLITVHMLVLIKQKHSQFPGPGRTEHNVVGSQFWPTYTIRTLGLFAWIAAVLFLLGGLVQIDPVWIYGPYEPAVATSPAQPDWFVGWVDGSLRLYPPTPWRVGGFLVPTIFFPGVVLPLAVFVILYLWPFAEQRLTHMHTAHQLLDRPREHPVRLGVGVGALVFLSLLNMTAVDDIAARYLRVPVTGALWLFRFLTLILPWVCGVVAWILARALRASESERFSEITFADLTAALRRRPAPAAAEAGPPAEAPAVERVPEPARRTETWPAPDDTWRWRYVDESEGGEPVSLTANVTVESEDEAAEAAHTAYPDAPVTKGPLVAVDRSLERYREERRAGPGARVLAALWYPVGFLIRRRRNRSRGPHH